jgi:hypothetical protein
MLIYLLAPSSRVLEWTVTSAEVFYEKEFGKSETVSGLVGLIWQVRDDLSFDLGVRHAVRTVIRSTKYGWLSFSFPVTVPVHEALRGGDATA